VDTEALLDAAPSVLGSFGHRLGTKALARLDAIGVEVRLGAKVVGVDGTGIDVEDARGQRRRIESSLPGPNGTPSVPMPRSGTPKHEARSLTPTEETALARAPARVKPVPTTWELRLRPCGLTLERPEKGRAEPLPKLFDTL
jgi:hypothetical protein